MIIIITYLYQEEEERECCECGGLLLFERDLTQYEVVFTPFTATVFILSILHDVLLENKDKGYHHHDCEDFENTLKNTLHRHIMSCQNTKHEEDHRCILT